MKKVGSYSIKRFIRIFIPFISLLLIFSFVIFSQVQNKNGSNNNQSVLKSEGTSTPTKNSNLTQIETPGHSPTPVATLNYSEVASIQPTSQNIPQGIIEVKGPPPNSTFFLKSPLTIYWTWSIDTINENYYFSVYLIDHSDEIPIGIIEESTLGNNGYHFTFTPGDFVKASGSYQIEVRLQQNDTSSTALRSGLLPVYLQ